MRRADALDGLSWFHGRPVLITGGSGFIGRNLVSRLAAVGADVHAVSRTHEPDIRCSCRWWTLDMADPAGVDRLVASTQPEIVFHLASRVTGSRSLDEVLPTLRDNVHSTVNLLSAAARNNNPRVVVAGSVDEPRAGDVGHPAASPYAVAKYAASLYAQLFRDLWSLPVTALRIAMVYGPAQRDRAKLIPYVVESLIAGHRPQLGSGRRLIDWVYVDDVVDALVKAGGGYVKADLRTPIDVGSGVGVSIRDTAEMIATIMGRPDEIDFGAIPDRLLEAPLAADPAAASELLGWRAVTSLKDGLERTVNWHLAQLEGGAVK